MNSGLGNAEASRAFDFEAANISFFARSHPAAAHPWRESLNDKWGRHRRPHSIHLESQAYLQPSIFFSAAEMPDSE
jgi:hypothetical protein